MSGSQLDAWAPVLRGYNSALHIRTGSVCWSNFPLRWCAVSIPSNSVMTSCSVVHSIFRTGYGNCIVKILCGGYMTSSCEPLPLNHPNDFEPLGWGPLQWQRNSRQVCIGSCRPTTMATKLSPILYWVMRLASTQSWRSLTTLGSTAHHTGSH